MFTDRIYLNISTFIALANIFAHALIYHKSRVILSYSNWDAYRAIFFTSLLFFLNFRFKMSLGILIDGGFIFVALCDDLVCVVVMEVLYIDDSGSGLLFVHLWHGLLVEGLDVARRLPVVGLLDLLDAPLISPGGRTHLSVVVGLHSRALGPVRPRGALSAWLRIRCFPRHFPHLLFVTPFGDRVLPHHLR